MTELSPQAKALMSKAARGGGPTEAQRRVLKGTLMTAVFGPALAAAATVKAVLAGVLVGVVAAGGIAAAVVRSQHHEPLPRAERVEVSPPPPAQTPVAPMVVEPVPLPAPPPPPRRASAPVERQPAPEPAPPVLGPQGRLAREMATLDRAMRAVDSGRFAEGLEEARGLLRDAPQTELATEARVVEVLALCGLLRFEEAQVTSMSLPPAAEGNPALRRLDSSCVERPSP